MYTSFFGLNEKPFSITPNPRYLYMSDRHTEALAHLIYGIKDSGGFVQLTGEVGTGKTTLIRSLLQRLPENADIALILNPQLSATEFLTSILTELHIPVPGNVNSRKALTDVLNHFLLTNHSKGRRTILIVDEAQNFSVDVLEQIRLLTNLETARQKLLQITLIGQPELREMLARTDMRQLAQRITGRYHLQPLNQVDTEHYIRHRLKVAGASHEIFSRSACRELYRLSGGIPRILNVIADRALLGAYTRDLHEVGPALVRRAAAEVYGEDVDLNAMGRTWVRITAMGILAAALIGFSAYIAMKLTPLAPTQVATQPARSAPQSTLTTPAATAVAQTSQPNISTGTAQDSGALDDFIRLHADETDTRTAFKGLFDLWGKTYDSANTRACEFAQQQQLYCLYQKGSLAQIQQLDRPVILTLRDNVGKLHQVVLAYIGDGTATIRIGDNMRDVPVNSLIELWYGEYLLLWKPQIGAVKAFYPGMRDPDVIWLRDSLAAIQADPIDPMDSDYFDENLAARVKDYQVTRRLNVDGLVGQQTQIVINSDLGADAPRLSRAN